MSESYTVRARREAAEDERDRLAHEQPNVPDTVDRLLDCPVSKYARHRFTARTQAGLSCCDFCGETVQAWLDKKRGRR